MSSNFPDSPKPPTPPPAAGPVHKEPAVKQPAAREPVVKEPAVKFTRAGALWSALITGFLTLILLLIFIAQNTASTPFQFLNLHWTLPLGVAILLAAVVGGLLTVAVGTARIIQLRRAAKKHFAAAKDARAGLSGTSSY